MRRLASLTVLLAAAAGVAAWFVLATPDFVQRERYPLRYQAIVRDTRATTASIPPSSPQ